MVLTHVIRIHLVLFMPEGSRPGRPLPASHVSHASCRFFGAARLALYHPRALPSCLLRSCCHLRSRSRRVNRKPPSRASHDSRTRSPLRSSTGRSPPAGSCPPRALKLRRSANKRRRGAFDRRSPFRLVRCECGPSAFRYSGAWPARVEGDAADREHIV